MTKSELIERLTLKHELPPKQVEASVKRSGGPNGYSLRTVPMTCGKE